MKKKFLLVLGFMLITSMMSTAYSKSTTSSDVANAIKLYKNGNYAECYQRLSVLVKKDPSNALAYYYLANTAAQVGKREEAIDNYAKAMALTDPNSNIYAFANKGKICLEDAENCPSSATISPAEEFIQSHARVKFSEKVKGDYEKLKIENFMREMNRSQDIEPQKFKNYTDFSSMNNEVPSNDEIVAALRTLQNAGLTNMVAPNPAQDLSMLTGTSTMNQNPLLNVMGNGNVNPQVIQALLTNNMSLGF